MALSGRPASLEGLTPEPDDIPGTAGLAEAPTVSAPAESMNHSAYWPSHNSVVPLARVRVAVPVPRVAPLVAPLAPAAAVHPSAAQPGAVRSGLPAVPPPRAARRSRKSVLLGVLAGFAAVLLLGATELRLPAAIEVAGTVHAPARAQAVAATRAGMLAQLLVQPGDAVVEQQVVAQLATAPFEAALQASWDSFLQRQAELLVAEPTSDASTRQDQTAALAQATWALIEAQTALAGTSVRAPCRGRVETLQAAPGSIVAPGQPLLHLAPAGVARSIIAFLPVEERPFVQPGSHAAVLLPAFGAQPQRGSDALVTQIAPDLATPEELRAVLPSAPAGGFVLMQLELQGAAPELVDQLRAGEPVSVRLQGRQRRALRVLLDSVRTLRG